MDKTCARVASIKFMEWSNEDIMRLPVFMGLREDKDPREVVNEMKVMPESNTAKSDTTEKKEKTVTLSGEKVKLTNTAKIYWKKEGYTKCDLITYYQNISRFILPYLKDRPQSLNRYPHGIEGQSFYQRRWILIKYPDGLKLLKWNQVRNPEGSIISSATILPLWFI